MSQVYHWQRAEFLDPVEINRRKASFFCSIRNNPKPYYRFPKSVPISNSFLLNEKHTVWHGLEKKIFFLIIN